MGKNKCIKYMQVSLWVVFLLGGVSLSALAATRTVTSTADTLSSGTLRYEINNATAGDTLVFNLAYPATITLSSGVLTLNKNLTILGPGVRNLTISGNNASRVFDITAGTITLSDVTIASGRLTTTDETGAGLRISGTSTVTLDRCLVRDCSLTHLTSQTYGAGAKVATTATLTVVRSCFYNNQNAPTNPGSQGGAIDNQGTLTLVDSLCVSNTAWLGGAIHDRALSPKVVTLTNSTFTGNTSDNQGAVFHWGTSLLSLTNCTITKNNSTDVGGSYEAGLSVYNNSGSPAGSIFTMKNTIVAQNSSINPGTPADSEIYIDYAGNWGSSFSYSSGGYNLIGSTGSQTYVWTTGDIVGTESSKQLANLANLADNGGHAASHVPNLGSQVINPASSNGSTFVDGRGYLRVSTSEKGATEYGASAPVATAATSITNVGFNANWNSMTGAAGYLLDVATDTGFTTFVTGYRGLDVSNVTTYAVTGLSSGTTYYYRVRGYNGVSQTYFTNTMSATILTYSPTVTPTFTQTPTFTLTPSATATRTSTVSATPTASITFTATPTATPTVTLSATSTMTRTVTQTFTATRTATTSATVTHTGTLTATPTVTLTATASVTRTSTGTVTATPTVTRTATASVTASSTPSITFTRTQTVTSTVSATASITPTATITRTATVTPTVTVTGTHTPTSTISVTSTVSPVVSATPTLTGTPAETSTGTATAGIPVGDVTAYPNPARETMHFVVKQGQAGKVEIRLYTVNGELVGKLQEESPAGTNVLAWQCRSASPGIYLVRVHSADGEKTFKVAVIH